MAPDNEAQMQAFETLLHGYQAHPYYDYDAVIIRTWKELQTWRHPSGDLTWTALKRISTDSQADIPYLVTFYRLKDTYQPADRKDADIFNALHSLELHPDYEYKKFRGQRLNEFRRIDRIIDGLYARVLFQEGGKWELNRHRKKTGAYKLTERSYILYCLRKKVP
jgi:hypothetical protein